MSDFSPRNESNAEDPAYWIEDLRQIECLTSAVRQEIVDAIGASGPVSIGELARELGVAADSLYYHVRKLIKVGLLVEDGVRKTARREETVYRVVGSPLALRYDVDDPVRTELMSRLAASMLRVAVRDFEAGFSTGEAVSEGPDRNQWCARLKAWLSPSQIQEVNRLLIRLRALFETRGPGEDARLCTLTWALSPVEARPVRRRTSGE